MSALEESLRRALNLGDAADPEYRLSIYQASERALEKMLAEKAVPGNEAQERRLALAEAISRIEDDFEADALPAGHADGSAAAHDAHDIDFADEDAGHRPPDPHADYEPGLDRHPPRRGLVSMPTLIGIGVALFLVIALYVLSTIFQSGDAVPAGDGGNEAQTGEAASPTNISWINVFSGANIETLSTPEGGRVEAITANGREAVRMQSPSGQTSEVMLAVGPGLVGEIAGSTVRVELTAGSPDSRAREFSVRCLFASNSICDRQRFVTSMQEEAFVFDIAVPGDAASPATLAIAPGVGGEGSDLDLFAVRMRVIG
ncbi:hypothetical protein LUX29_19190 [Aureimonas altamirensis]|uniref:hypothetical protein n=1 Tax=Aureimonas altamirensis TaxID=370622 RepID=UPI001E48E479|nr:hypothetical protein [Aureimonas altamirensis]UHD45114.1 hypothetical protein LUX29_19190 [Aureimonas altamirensis]